MCGRINIIDHEPFRVFFEWMGIELHGTIDAPRYNIAPSAYIPVIANQNKQLSCSNMAWGLTPKWAKPGQLLINARSETLQQKPSFKHLFEKQRAVIPATGFYEWKREANTKRPYHFEPQNADLFLMAGVWSVSSDGEPQCCIVTSAANETMKPVHHRMPLLLDKTMIDGWVNGEPKEASAMLNVPDDDWLSCYEVSAYVNNARNDGAECVLKASV